MSSLTRQLTVNSVSHPSLFVDVQVSFLKVKLEFSEQQAEWNEQRAQSASTDTQICLLCLFAGDKGKLNRTSETFQYVLIQKKKQILFQYRFTLLYTHHYNTKEQIININIPAADRFNTLLWGQGSSLLRSKIQAVRQTCGQSDFGTKIAQISVDKARLPLTTLFNQKWYSHSQEIFPHASYPGLFTVLINF